MDKQVAIIDLSKKIMLYKEQFVMLDADVAEIYGVQTKDVNRAVKNNPQKFPEGYIITPDKEELANLRLKIFTSSCDEVEDLRSKQRIANSEQLTDPVYSSRFVVFMALRGRSETEPENGRDARLEGKPRANGGAGSSSVST